MYLSVEAEKCKQYNDTDETQWNIQNFLQASYVLGE